MTFFTTLQLRVFLIDFCLHSCTFTHIRSCLFEAQAKLTCTAGTLSPATFTCSEVRCRSPTGRGQSADSCRKGYDRTLRTMMVWICLDSTDNDCMKPFCRPAACTPRGLCRGQHYSWRQILHTAMQCDLASHGLHELSSENVQIGKAWLANVSKVYSASFFGPLDSARRD